jgi:hypothetical protein
LETYIGTLLRVPRPSILDQNVTHLRATVAKKSARSCRG